MTRILRVAIIGYGKVGRIRHRCVEAHPNLTLTAIGDLRPHAGEGLTDVFFSTDWREVLEQRPDVVFVCTTNETIPDVATAAIDLGIHTFCEKPPGRTVADVQRMIDAETRNPGVKLVFGFNHRYHQAVLDAKAIIDKGRLGKILWLRGVYGKAGGPTFDRDWRNDPERSGGGILIDQGIHMLDLFHFFCRPFEEVKSFVGHLYWQVPVEDNVMCILRNSQGQMGMLHSSATQWRHTFVLDIYLERGYLSIEGILSSTMTYGQESLKVAHCIYDHEGYPLPNPQESLIYYSEDTSWMQEVEYFISCVLESKAVKNSTSAQALAVMEAIHIIYFKDAPGMAAEGNLP